MTVSCGRYGHNEGWAEFEQVVDFLAARNAGVNFSRRGQCLREELRSLALSGPKERGVPGWAGRLRSSGRCFSLVDEQSCLVYAMWVSRNSRVRDVEMVLCSAWHHKAPVVWRSDGSWARLQLCAHDPLLVQRESGSVELDSGLPLSLVPLR